MTSLSNAVDAVTVSVVWNALVAITEEMGTALRNSAYSAAVREGDDFSTAIFDKQGRLVAQGNFTPGHLGAMPYVLRHVAEYYPPETLEPGDGILLNDSFLGSGHFPDCYLVSPVHDGDELIGYSVNVAHQVDVGGAAPGSQMVHGVTEAFQEGLRILPTRIMRRGEFDEAVLRLILGNVRLPDVVRGDLTAQRSANYIGTAQLLALHRKFGRAVMETAIEEILDRSEEYARDRIRQIPAGRYAFADFLDDAGPGTPPIRVAVEIRVGDGEIDLDFSGSSDQVAAAINSYINYTRAYSFFAVKVFTDSKLPQNDGAIRPITVRARPGSFFNPSFPAPSGGRATVQVRIFEAINGALAKALPEKAIAGFSHWSNPNIGGVDDRTGEPFVFYDLIMGGYGASACRDGSEGLAPVMNCANIPIEMHELTTPVRIHRFALIPDSGGAGKFRGGCGVRKDVELLAASAKATMLSDRHLYAPYGLFGGKEGRKGQTILTRNGRKRPLGSKDVVTLQRGDILSFQLSGGGGFGDPAERDPTLIQRDVAEGFATPGSARKAYGADRLRRGRGKRRPSISDTSATATSKQIEE